MRTHFVSSLLLLIVLPLGAPAQSAPAPSHVPEHVFGDPNVTEYAPTRTFHVENYKIEANLDLKKKEIAGDDIVTLRPLQSGFKTFYLNSAQLQIESVSLLAEHGASSPLHFRTEDPKLWISLDREYAPTDLLKIRIVYHGNPEGRPFPDAGLSFIEPDAQSPNRPLEAWSYGWPENNHFWFPCWDYPNDKATSEVVLTVPEPLSVVSNGELVKVSHRGTEATFDWVEHVPHSAYLTSIAVGPWKKYSQHYKSKPVDYYVPPGVDEATALRSFGLTPDMMGFYSTIFGVEYPYEKYAQTADHNFGGGTENISATSLAQTTLHDARAEPDYPSIDLVSHELAHQWFGDLLTEWSWDEAWLSEGFATFSAALYRGHHDGLDAYRYQIWQDQRTAMREDTLRYRRPIIDRHYTKPWQMLDRTTYQKGAAVLDMLRYVMDGGVEEAPSPQEPLFQVLHTYLSNYRAKNVDTQNLIDTIRTTTGQELGWFFDEWTTMGGYPQYAVHPSYDSTKRVESIAIRQTQTVDAVTPLFDMPVQLVFYGAGGERQEARIRVHLSAETIEIAVPFEPLWMDFDPHGHIYKTLSIQEPLQALIARGERDPDMMSRLWAAEQLGKSGADSSQSAVGALSRMLEQDSFYGVRAAAAQSLGEAGGDAAKNALLQALPQPDSRVRVAAVEALGRFAHDPAVYEVLVRALRGDTSYAVEAAAAVDLGETGSPQALDELEKEVASNPNPHVMAGLLPALAQFKNARAEATLEQQSQSGATDEVRQLASRALQTMRSSRR